MKKNKNIIMIIFVYVILLIIGFIFNHVKIPISNNGIIFISYLINVSIIIFMVIKIDKESLQVVGFTKISILDITGGFILGIVLYLMQILPPIFFMHIDISSFGNQPNFTAILLRFLFLAITVGLGEELVYRGYFLHKLENVFSSQLLVVCLNCMLFYGSHLTKIFQFNITEVYSTFLTTILLCTYFYLSKKRSIIPLIIAHAVLDTLMGKAGFSILNLLMK
ncbi:CPBP family intramembrane glutamic endopeptidase [Inediibacterium massiliense]|uniref:CPBP family intramembrane glutamic endopeptidase n=1 Tax=Inediibacterium massiliense TaxID=1658111 RepID=UPI0006B57D3E|nr:CPBP family intramembrane glutamic endopeptidase [Inediibacterium massiliense]